MKKYFKYYAVCWAIALLVFNVIVFVSIDATKGFSELSTSFWLGYGFITLTFIGNLVCNILFFKENNRDKVFLNLSVVRLAFGALIASLIAGIIAMAVPAIPYFVGIIADVLILGFYAIAITKAAAGADIVQSKDKEIKQKTFFIKSLTVDAQTLMSRAQSVEAKELAKKVYEAVRYSDPMSSEALSGAEASITLKFKEFESAILNNNYAVAAECSKDLLILINDRNQKCKLLK